MVKIDTLDVVKDKSILTFSTDLEFSKIEEIQDKNNYYTKVKIRIMYVGLNQNGSYMSKETILKAIPSISYMPILANIVNDDCTDHAIDEFEINGDKLKAYGVIFENPNAYFEEIKCSDGVIREFLFIEGLIWNRFQDFKTILERDKIKNQSMEICIKEFKINNETNVKEILDFDFIGACILGNNVAPAYINSNIQISDKEMFTLNESVKNRLSLFTQFIKNERSKDMASEVIQDNNEVQEQIVEHASDQSTIVENNQQKGHESNEPSAPVVDVVDNVDDDNKHSDIITNQQKENKEEEIKMSQNDTLVNNNTNETFNENDKGITIQYKIKLEEKDKEIFELNKQLEEQKQELDKIKKEYSLYQKAIDTEKKQEILEKYSSVLKNDNEYLELLKGSNMDKYNANDLEKELNSIIGKKSLSHYSYNNDYNRSYFTADTKPKQNSIFGNFFN